MSEDLDALVNQLAAATLALRGLLLDAAKAEAEYRGELAKATLVAKAEGHTVAIAEATAASECADLLLARLTTAAVAKSQEEMIRSLRARIDAAQTVRADMRAADVAMARGHGGGV